MYYETTRCLIVIDPGVYDYERWLDRNQSNNTDILVLSKGFDGSTQIADYVASQDERFAEIHIISYGSVGALHLGSTTLTRSNIGSFATESSQIRQGLIDGGDVQLYGFEVASGSSGQQFVATLAALTGADAAASKDMTVPAAPEGTSFLEVQTGSIEAPR